MLQAVLEGVMDAQANELCNADYNQRSAERTNSRNGYRERPFDTRLGGWDLRERADAIERALSDR